MKNVFLLILCILMMACSTTKKSVQSKEVASVATEKTEAEKNTADKLIDTTKTEKGKITITEIEFYPPAVNDELTDSNEKQKTTISGLSLLNIGDIDNAAIKSIKQTIIESESEAKGESKESSSTASIINEAMVGNIEKTVMTNEEPAPDPYKWRYIFYSLFLVAIAFLYFKRVPVLNWIKTILSNLRRIF